MQNNIFFTPHFSLLEMTESETAKKHGIENIPSPEAVENLKRLCLGTLEPLREALGQPVIVTSGFRCQRLNEIISHSARKSQHLNGQAADFYIGWNAALNGRGQSGEALSSRKRLIKAFRLILTSHSTGSEPVIDFDQLILYPNFIHASYVSDEANRHYIMIAKGDGKYRRVSREAALNII